MKEKVTIGNATIYLGDCKEILPSLPVFDLILTDPPYGLNISAKGFVGRGSKKHEKSDWDKSTPSAWVFGLLQDRAKHLICWGGNYFPLPHRQGYFVWDKMQVADIDFAMCELAWVSFKISAQIYKKSFSSYAKEHPTQKPVELMEWCISKSPDNETICDPFTGSGTTGVAALRMGKSFVGIELERMYFDLACERIDRENSQPQLFNPAKIKPDQTVINI